MKRVMSTAALAVAVSLAVAAPVRAQVAVFDPANFQQNVLTATRTLEQLNQQANAMDPEQYRRYALAATAREKDRVARLRQRGLLD